jgi:hypothetical protein
MQSSALILRDLSKQKSHSRKSLLQNSTHYEVLQISETATFEVIRSAYLQQIRMYHNGVSDTVKHYQAVIGAYRILKSPETRQAYDTWLAVTRAKSIKSMENLIATLNSAIETLPSSFFEEQATNHINPLACICAGTGLSYAILMMGVIAALCDPESMLGIRLLMVGFLATCVSCYVLVRYNLQKQAIWERDVLEPMNTVITHLQRIDNTIAFIRERTPKLTYVPQQSEMETMSTIHTGP